MSSLRFLFRFAASLLSIAIVSTRGQNPAPAPAEFETLEITFQLEAGPRLVETRIGQVRWNASPALFAVRQLLAPMLGAAGSAKARELVLLRADGSATQLSAGPPQRAGDMLCWPLTEVQPGDAVRFVIEQQVDLRGKVDAWWYSDSTMIPMPVQHGSLRLRLPADFKGSVDIVDTAKHRTSGPGEHSWVLDGALASRGTAHFTVSSFENWKDLTEWVVGHCPANAGVGIQQMSEALMTSASAAERARRAADALSRRLRVQTLTDGRFDYSCRPVEQVLAAGTANPLEIQAVFVALLESAGIPADPFLSGPGAGPGRGVDPDVFSRALIRVNAGGHLLWFDVVHLVGEDGHLDARTAAQSALSLRDHQASWIPLLPEGAENEFGKVVTTLDAAITMRGTLQAAFVLTASGPPSQVYREAFQPGSGRGGLSRLLGPFMHSRRLRSGPLVNDPYDIEHPFVIHLPIHEEEFLIPIQRQVSLLLSTIPLAPEPRDLGYGKLVLGTPGSMREQITLEIPTGFVTSADFHLDEDRAFGHYHSEASVAGGKLRVTRELDLKQAVIDASVKPELESLLETIRADQQRPFILRRTRQVDARGWIESIAPYRANDMGLKALEQQQYDAARQLFERAAQANPKDEYAWNNLGRALSALRRFEEAQKAYEKQIAINPKDIYVYNNLGLVYEAEGNWVKAVESFRKQLEVNPGDQFATRNLPQALLQLAHWDEAATAAANAAQAQPNNRFHLLHMALARVCQDKAGDRRKELDEALGVSPPAPLLNNAAYYLTQCGKEWDLAEEYVRRAIRQNETRRNSTMSGPIAATLAFQFSYGSYLDTLGWLLFKKGQTEPAAGMLAAAAMLTQHAEVYAHLATAMLKLGQPDDAARWGHEAITLAAGLRAQLPPEVAAQAEKIPPLSVNGTWYPLAIGAPISLPASVPVDQPLYYFVIANPTGEVHSARTLDEADAAAQDALHAVDGLRFPTIRAQGQFLSVAHFVKLIKMQDGKVAAYRSLGPDAVNLAMDLAPGEFLVPQEQGRK